MSNPPKTRYASTGFRSVEADSMVRTGEAAIRLAENTGVQLYCYANPVDDGGPVTLDQAREIAKEDANLIYAHETH